MYVIYSVITHLLVVTAESPSFLPTFVEQGTFSPTVFKQGAIIIIIVVVVVVDDDEIS